MADIKTDEEILTEYYNTVYCSESYKIMTNTNKTYNLYSKLAASSEKSLPGNLLFLLFSIYFSMMLVLKTGIVFFPLLIAIPIYLLYKTKKSYEYHLKEGDNSRQHNEKYTSEFIKLKNETPVPPLPKDKLNEEAIKKLLDIFASKRADTFKEALNIYEQDIQYQKLLAEQQAARAAAINAVNEANRARREAEAAKKEAEYQRREAEYWRAEEEYYRNR